MLSGQRRGWQLGREQALAGKGENDVSVPRQESVQWVLVSAMGQTGRQAGWWEEFGEEGLKPPLTLFVYVLR